MVFVQTLKGSYLQQIPYFILFYLFQDASIFCYMFVLLVSYLSVIHTICTIYFYIYNQISISIWGKISFTLTNVSYLIFSPSIFQSVGLSVCHAPGPSIIIAYATCVDWGHRAGDKAMVQQQARDPRRTHPDVRRDDRPRWGRKAEGFFGKFSWDFCWVFLVFLYVFMVI